MLDVWLEMTVFKEKLVHLSLHIAEAQVGSCVHSAEESFVVVCVVGRIVCHYCEAPEWRNHFVLDARTDQIDIA